MIKLLILSILVLSIAIPAIQETYSVPTYKLTIKTIPNNLMHITGAGTFEPNTMATTGTAPEEFEGWRFLEWQVDGVPYEGNPINILMDKGRMAIAYYSDDIAEITIDTEPLAVAKITVDGQVYLPIDLPEEFEWDIGTVHNIETEAIVTDGATRYIFTGWNDLVEEPFREQTVIEDFELKALYDTEHFIAASSLYGDPIGDGWYQEGEEVTVPVKT